MPIHSIRLQERGYNQALELARPIAKKLKLSIDTISIERIKNTPAQLHLPAHKRKQNIMNAFNITKTLNYKHIAIIDDVITTGCTVYEICKTIQRNSIHKIDVWCFAKVDCFKSKIRGLG